MPSAHILLVDDDALMRRSLAFNLEQNGYRVSTSASGEDALAVARNDLPDLVLLDIGLPGMDGLEALRQFRQTISTPIIFLTCRGWKPHPSVSLTPISLHVQFAESLYGFSGVKPRVYPLAPAETLG